MLRTTAQKIRAWSYRPEVARTFSLAWRMIKLMVASCVVSLFSIKFLSLDHYLVELLPGYITYRMCWILIFGTGIVVSATLAFFYRKTYYFFAEGFFLAAAHVGIFFVLYTASHNVTILLTTIAFVFLHSG